MVSSMGRDRCDTGSRRGPGELEAGPRGSEFVRHLLQSKHGALDVVPEVSGTYDELIARAVRLDNDGVSI